jgi:hypothetical protein
MDNKEPPSLVREAFNYYYALGNERSYARVALKFHKAVSTVEKWGKAYNWQAKVEEREVEKRKKVVEQAIVEKELDYTQRNLKIIRRGILEHAKAIQNGSLKPSYKVLIELIEAERRIVTGNMGEVNVNHRIELGKLTNDEIKKAIDEKLNKLVGFQQIASFSAMKDPILDAEYTDISGTRSEKNEG